MSGRFVALARSTPGRIVAMAAGLGGVTLILRGVGWSVVARALVGAAAYFPFVLVLELCILACTMRALRALYGDAAREIPRWQFVRAGLIGYAVMGLVPAGRAVADVAFASLLGRWVGAGRAGAAAVRLHGVALVANGLVSIPAAIAALVAVGASWLPLAIAINAAVTLVLGGGVLAAVRYARIGAWLGRRMRRAATFGAEFDAVIDADRRLPFRAIGWELAGRVIQVTQHALLIVCVGGALGLRPALCAEGIHLVGAAVGNLIPAQLGATEGNFTLAAGALGLSAASAVSIAVLAHLAQLVWVVVGSIVPLVWRPTAVVDRPTDANKPA